MDFVARRGFLREIFYLVPESGRLEPIYRARVGVAEVVSEYLQGKLPALSRAQAQQKSFLLIHGILGIVESYIMLDPEYFSPDDFKNEVRKTIRFFLLDS